MIEVTTFGRLTQKRVIFFIAKTFFRQDEQDKQDFSRSQAPAWEQEKVIRISSIC
jgi:hypothetical protein